MKFGPVPLADALGAVVAHAVKHGPLVLKKGAIVTPDDIRRLAEAQVREIVVARFEPGDVAENDAALAIATAVAGAEVRVDEPFTGRANLFSSSMGVLTLDTAAIDALNGIDEAITLATLPNLRRVTTGEMVGTVKIIPFAVAGGLVQAATAAGQGALRVVPYRGKQVGVVSTLLPGLKPSVVDKTLAVLEERLRAADNGLSRITSHDKVAHEAAALTGAIRRSLAGGAEVVIVFGASAITDRRDVVPSAILAAGGAIEHFGMPVDPGNLLLLGSLAGRTVIGAPGCARSPRENGFDWVLQRTLADVPVTRADIQRMGVGGLLMEIVSRPQPRAPAEVKPPPVAAIVLAAGRSSRMGHNKLVAPVDGVPMVRRAVQAALASQARPVIVVTGHEREAVREALAGLDVTFVYNLAHLDGLATSLQAGIGAVPDECQAALVLLGDMPSVTPAIVDRLLAALADKPQALAVAPVVAGQRGNPVIIGRGLFPAVATLRGDTGARRLLDAAGEQVVEVPILDEAVLLDVDTPEALAKLSGTA
jgi:molybdenum cofactor cytidylyltransferase